MVVRSVLARRARWRRLPAVGQCRGRPRGAGGGPSAWEQAQAALGLALPEGVPALRAVQRPQTGHGLCPRQTPAHPGPGLPLLDQVLGAALDGPRADGELPRPKLGIAHARGMVRK